MTPKERLRAAADDLSNATEDVCGAAYEGVSETGKGEMLEALGQVKQAVKEIEEIIR